MQVSAVALHLVAMGTALWIAFRRGGIRLMVALAAVLAILTRAYGAETLTQAWTSYLPLLSFIFFLLALWWVADDALPLLPVAVVAGSFCAQTHVPYLGLTLGRGGLVAVWASWTAYRRRKNKAALRRFFVWSGVAVGLAAILWTPPVIDQIVHTPGNLSVLSDYFRNPPESPVGLRRAIDVFFVHLNPWHLVEHLVTADRTKVESGSLVPGALFLTAWAASAVAALRIRHPAVLRHAPLLRHAPVVAPVCLVPHLWVLLVQPAL